MKRTLAIAAVLAGLGCGTNAQCDGMLLTGTCVYPASAGECVDFAGLSTADENSAGTGCTTRGGSWVTTTACPTAGRVGTCTLAPNTQNTDVSCSAHSKIQVRYYPAYTTATAQTACAAVSASTFTPN